MSSSSGGGRRRKKKHETAHADERWLLTYSDLITLLMALFVIFFAMSSTDAAKYKQLKNSLSSAFSGKPLDGGSSVLNSGTGTSAVSPMSEFQRKQAAAKAAAKAETENLQSLKKRIDAYAKTHDLQSKLEARVEKRGLVVTVLTDKLLFDSGSATLQPAGETLMTSIGQMLRSESDHDVIVEGYTDDVPTSGTTYPTNWELSTARASTVVRSFLRANVSPQRMTASGRAYLDPVASNNTASGREANRRVQIVIPRNAVPTAPTSSSTTSSTGTTNSTSEPSVDIPDIVVGAKETP
jgi:chemotaxis protein MotB